MSSITPERKMIGDLLQMGLAVPEWQRNYSWTDDEWLDIWNDLSNYNTRRTLGATSPYFIGTVILIADSTPKQILDGQQRLATSTILLAAIRDALNELTDSDEALEISRDIHKDFIMRGRSYSEKGASAGLCLNLYDKAFFRDTIWAAPANLKVNATQESHELIRSAYLFFKRRIDATLITSSSSVSIERIRPLVSSLTESFLTVTIEVTDEREAMRVFEVVNDRGFGLSTEDLVRAYLLQRENDATNRESIVQTWQEIFELYKESKYRNYLRHFWISRYGDVKSKALAETIRVELQAKSIPSVKFSDELRASIDTYRDIIDGKVGKSKATLATSLREELQAVSDLAAVALYPVILSAFEEWNGMEDRIKLLRALVVAYIRHTVVGKRESTLLEAEVYGLARDIRAKKIDADGCFKSLSKFAPNDKVFSEELKTCTIERSATAQYMLRAIENHRKPSEEFMLRGRSQLWVEHIIPQSTPRTSELRPYVKRLGNLTLMSDKKNRQASDRPYATKRSLYKVSDISITKELGNKYPTWNVERLIARQADLASTASAVWAF
jgi:Protein of unknown function DUF262/Protein of unknown function (DUF1524)